MKRWHQEQQMMHHRWRQEMGIHGYDWRCPPTDPSACHCVAGIGSFRKRKPHDCGQARCHVCHWGKWLPKGRHQKKLKAIEFDLSAEREEIQMTARFIDVSDEREGDAKNVFVGVTNGVAPNVGDILIATVFVTSTDNGFGWPEGAQVATLKHLGDGVFGS